MKGRLPHVVILGSSLVFLASLYFTWISMTPSVNLGALRGNSGAKGLLNLFAGTPAYGAEGWGTYGEAAAIAAVALGPCALVSLVRPELESRLPFGGCAIALAALAVVNVAALRTDALVRGAWAGFPVHLGTGAYVGGAAALAALLGAAVVSRDELAELGTATVAVATLLTIGLVAAYVLPTLNATASDYFAVSVGSYGSAIMLLIASFGLTFWFGAELPLRRISAAAVILVLTVGGFSTLGTHTHWPYEAWLAIGCAVGLLVLAVASSRERPLLALGRPDAIALSGAALLLVSFFFHWQKSCPSPPRGACFVSNGWGGGLTGGLVAIFVVALLGFRHLAPELAIAIGIYVLAHGLADTAHGSLGYGAFLGFAGTALILLAVGLQPRKAVRGGTRLIPVVTCVALLAIPVATLTDRLSTNIEINGGWRLPLLEAAAIVVGLRLIGRWLSGPTVDDELVLLPLALLVLVGLDLVETQHIYAISWEGWLSLALGLVLVALGWLERYRGGLGRFGVPDEIWRVDRISAGEN